MSNPTYDTIDNPYDQFMQRAELSSDVGSNLVVSPSDTGSGDVSSGGGESSGPGAGTQVESPGDLPEGVVQSNNLDNLFIKSWIKSNNYQPKIRGFYIDGVTGYIECRDFYSNNIIVEGGTLAGWRISSGYIYKLASGTPTVTPSSGIVLASGNTGIIIYETTKKRVELGYLSAGVYGLKGYASDGTTVIFEMSGTQQKLAGWNFTDKVIRSGTTDANSNVLIDSENSLLRLGPTTGNYLSMDGANLRIRSSNYTAGQTGFNITPEKAEFGDVKVRGEIQSAIMAYQQITATAGTRETWKSGGKLLNDVTSVASPTTFNVDIQDPDFGHVQLFAASDIIRIKDGVKDNWFTISSVSNQTTFYRYVCTLSNGSPTAFKAGASVIDYGQSGQGGLVETADASNGPYMKVINHAGSPWSTMDTKVMVGNLFDKTGVTEYGIWIKSGAAYIAGYRLFEAVVNADGTGDYTTLEDAVTAGKTRIFVRNGTYNLSANISITANNTIITGESRDGVVFTDSGVTKHKITVTANNCILTNFSKTEGPSTEYAINLDGDDNTITGLSLTDGGTTGQGIYLSANCDRCVIERNKIVTAKYQIMCAGGSYNLVKDNYTEATVGGGGVSNITVDTSALKTVVTNNRNISGYDGYLISCAGVQNLISNNYCYNSKTTSSPTGIYVTGVHNIVTANFVEGCYYGIYADTYYAIQVIGNQCKGQGLIGIYVSGNTTAAYGYSTINDNVVYDPGTDGIYLFRAVRTIFNGNAVYGASRSGFRQDTGYEIDNCIFSNNIVGETGATSHGYYFAVEHQRNCVFLGNLAYGNTNRGFYLQLLESCTVVGNVSSNNGSADSVLDGGGALSQIANNVFI